MINSLYVSHLLMLMALLEIAHLSVAALAKAGEQEHDLTADFRFIRPD